MQSFMPVHFFVFKIRTIENGFAGPKRFRGFRETGPWPLNNNTIDITIVHILTWYIEHQPFYHIPCIYRN